MWEKSVKISLQLILLDFKVEGGKVLHAIR